MTKNKRSGANNLLIKVILFIIELIAVLLLYFISDFVVKYFAGNLKWLPFVIVIMGYVFLIKYIKKLVEWISSKINK